MSTLVNAPPVMVKEACNYCGHPNGESHKRIRNGFICQECLNRAREEAAVAKKNLQSQGLTGNGIAAFLAAIGGVVCFLMGYPWIGVFLIVMAFSFGSSHETKKDPKADERRKNLGDVESAARSKLQSIYAQFIELPPDWRDRRRAVRKRDNSKCRECGKRFYSEFGFHLHHLTPKSKPEGSHRLSNLVLLCDRCHRKHHPWMR